VEPPPEVNPPQFSYSDRVVLTEVGVPMTPLAPVLTSPGVVQMWTLEGELPLGLSFDAQNGEISGTPGELTPARALTVLGSHADGSDSVRLSISVSGVQRFAYSANSGDNTLGQLIVNQESDRLESNGFLTQSPGESSPEDVQADPFGRLIYSVNSFALTPYLVDSQSGELTPGAPLSIGAGPHSLYVHPGGQYLYLTSGGNDRLRVYQVDAAQGALDLVQEVMTALEPIDIAGDAAGRFLVVGHENDGELRSYTIDSVTGEVQLAHTLALPDVVTPDIELGPLGEALYVVLRQPLEGVLRCLVDPTTAQLTIGSTVNSGSAPLAMTIEPGRRFAYVLKEGSGDISYYSIADSNGKLTLLGELPSTSGAVSMRFTSDGSTALVVDAASREARQYALQPDGTLVLSSSTRLRQAPVAMARVEGTGGVTRSADRIYVLNGDSSDVTLFYVDRETGEVTDNGVPAFPTSTAPIDLALDPLGRYAYVSSPTQNHIQVFSVDSEGALVDSLTPFEFPAGSVPSQLIVDRSGRFLYATLQGFNLLAMFKIEADGSLSSTGTRPILLEPERLVIDPEGLYLYVVQGGNRTPGQQGSFRSFRINAADGGLQLATTTEAFGHPMTLRFTSSGKRAFSPQYNIDRLVPWNLNPTGTATAVAPGTVSENEPVDIALSQDERLAFAACKDETGNGSVLVYDVDPVTGKLFNKESDTYTWRHIVSAGVSPVAVETSHEGRFFYVLSEVSEELRVFSVDPETGLPLQLQIADTGLRPTRMVRRTRIQ
jgi:6-phosphogluconolactonase (cycloisomerase 2 family)